MLNDKLLASVVYEKMDCTKPHEDHFKLDCAHKRQCLRENVRRVYQIILKSYETRTRLPG